MALVLALIAALAYGLSDFVGGALSRRTSPWVIAFVAQLTGAVLLVVIALIVGGTPERSDYAWSLLAGLGNGVGTAFLYRGLAAGRMGVVAPVSGVGAALLPVVVGVATGERPGVVVWLGILAAVPAIWLVAGEPRSASAPSGANGSGLIDGVLAGLGFGTLFVALAQFDEAAGLLPLAANQVIACVVIVAVATLLSHPWLPREPRAAYGAGSGVLGSTATALFLLATQSGYLTVTAVITSLYPAFTVVLAATLLREHIHRAQAIGLALCAVAVALVAAG